MPSPPLPPMKTESIRRSSNHDRMSFSPIKLEDPHPPSGVNLTGAPRRVRDRCADIYNTLGKWHKAKLRGARLIREIATRNNRAELMLESCDNLLKVVEDLETLVDTLKKIRDNFEALVEMHALSRNMTESGPGINETGDHAATLPSLNRIPFVNFTLEDYEVMTQEIENAYRREIMFKRMLVRKIPKQTSASVFTLASLFWMHDTFIDEKINSMVFALVAECGFE